ncbi:MAG: 4Fe-4S binding protein [Deltaproteobacteria bacterium]|nr:4Fe-4S binding protein [Deltaproteobacteria bacterium]
MSTDVYTRLREFMDTLPAGFPATPTGVEIKILKKLFTPEQAELAMKLGKEAEEVSAIAARIGMDEPELARKLEEMAQKGLIFRVRDKDKVSYQAAQFLVGVYEFQLNRLDKEFCELFEEYLPHIGATLAPLKTKQLRVIPVESSVEAAPTVASYNRIRDLVKDQEVISLAQCICRKERGLLGKPCAKPQETCLGFGDFGRFFIDNHLGRAISTDEALRKLDQAEEAGLVLNPSNTQKIEWICCCCTCCCPTLKFVKMMPRPADWVRAYYQAKIDADLCIACGECLERCQMAAIKEGQDFAEMIEGRCIGCGLCVSTCPVEAISLQPKPGMEAPPASLSETLRKIERERRALARTQ